MSALVIPTRRNLRVRIVCYLKAVYVRWRLRGIESDIVHIKADLDVLPRRLKWHERKATQLRCNLARLENQ